MRDEFDERSETAGPDMNYTNFQGTPPPADRRAPAPIKAWDKGVEIDSRAMDQLHNVAALPFIYRHVAAMPDAHWGVGSTMGSVIPTRNAIIPAAVGVDIGCGMMAVRLGGIDAADLPDSLGPIRGSIEKAVPVGFAVHPERN